MAHAATPHIDHTIIRDAAELTARVEQARAAGYHVLSPATTISAFGESYGVQWSEILIQTDPEKKEIYHDDRQMEPDEWALTRIGLQRIEQVAGVSWIYGASRRTDDRSIRNFWEYESWLTYLTWDGTPRMCKGTQEVDLRDGSAQIGEYTREAWDALMQTNRDRMSQGTSGKDLDWSIGGWSQKRLLQARSHGLPLAETKSQGRAIRNAFGIKHAYRLQELKRPFVVLRVVWVPDLRDPEMRLLYAQRALQGSAVLYPGAAASAPRALPEPTTDALADAINITPQREPVPVRPLPSGGASAPPATTAPPSQPAPPVRTPATDPPSALDVLSAAHNGTGLADPPPPAHDGGKTAAVVDELRARGVESRPQDRSASTSPRTTTTPPAGYVPGTPCLIVHYHEDPPKPRRNGEGTFIKAHVETSDGRALTCVYGKFRDRLRRAHADRTPIVVHHKRSEYDGALEVDKLDDVGAPQDRSLPGLDRPDTFPV